MNLLILGIVAIVAIIAMFIFLSGFRDWIGRQLAAAWGWITFLAPTVGTWVANIFATITRIAGVYYVVLACIALFALVLTFFAFLINAPGLIAFAFILDIGLILLAWAPVGVLLRIFRITSGIVPVPLKVFIAWVAFVGFLGLVFPDVLSFRSLCGVALIALVALATAGKTNVIDKIIFPFVMIICLGIAWQHFFPENFRSTTRYAVSWDKKINTIKDRGSINNETDAATTYAVVLKDIKTLYAKGIELNETDTVIPEEKCELRRGTIVRVISHKQEVKVIDGQGFLRIQLAKNNGSFVNGKKYWVEAEFVQVAGPRDIVPKDDSLLPKNQKKLAIASPVPADTAIALVPVIPTVKDSVFTKGTYRIHVNGATPFNIVVISKEKCKMYQLNATGGYNIAYDDGVVIADGPGIQQVVPYREKPRFQLKSNMPVTIKMVVA